MAITSAPSSLATLTGLKPADDMKMLLICIPPSQAPRTWSLLWQCLAVGLEKQHSSGLLTSHWSPDLDTEI